MEFSKTEKQRGKKKKAGQNIIDCGVTIKGIT